VIVIVHVVATAYIQLSCHRTARQSMSMFTCLPYTTANWPTNLREVCIGTGVAFGLLMELGMGIMTWKWKWYIVYVVFLN